MKSMQKLITQELENQAELAMNRLTVERDWSNTGLFYIFLEDGPHSMRFSFQSDYVTLSDGYNSYSYWYTRHWQQLMTALRHFATTGNVKGVSE